MDWQALALSVRLAAMTTLVLVPVSVIFAYWLAWNHSKYKGYAEAIVALPLVLPPTVIGYYLLVSFGNSGWIGKPYQHAFDSSLAFSFTGLLLASLLVNLPFAIQPMQRSFERIPKEVRESAWCCGLSPWKSFLKVELPLARNGVIGAALLTFTHTLGEFGVVLMVGGNIPGETRTISIAIFDRVEAFDSTGVGLMSLSMLIFSTLVIGTIFVLLNGGQHLGVKK